ncbi:VWA domain-containing protein [Endozoicomonas sp.]|uniref:VWA domain-containing protein n=1 Tax=Endozoicomonas sp. TaxID=1892382 RepID=UPI00383B654B
MFDFASIRFEHPQFFVLWLLPWLINRFLPAYHHSSSAIKVPFFQRLAQLSGQTPSGGAALIRRILFQRIWLGAAWFLLVIALAKPLLLGEPVSEKKSTTDLMMLVDLSASMEATDFLLASGQAVDRLTALKQVLADFAGQRENDRLGLIVFADNAYLQVPFTADHGTFLQLLDELEIGMAGQQTRLGDGVGLAIQLFESSQKKHRVLLVLTDGNDTGSRVPPIEAAKVAASKGIRIYSIAMGDPASIGEAALDIKSLQQMATVTGGSFYQAMNSQQLQAIYGEIDALEQEQYEVSVYQPRQDVFYWPLGLVVVVYCLFHVLLLINNRYRLRQRDRLVAQLKQAGSTTDAQ